MTKLLNALPELPDLIMSLFSGKYLVFTIIGAVIFLAAALVSTKITQFIRKILIFGGIIAGVICYFKKFYTWVWLIAALLLIMAVIRLLHFLLVTIRQEAINRRIEKRALEKAARRRGSWKEKKGFSGKKKPDDSEPPVVYTMNAAEIDDVVNNETTERQGAKIPVDDARQMPVQNAFTQQAQDKRTADDGTLSRTVVIDAIQKLTDLRDLGVLTDTEFIEKRSWLYSHLG